MSSNPTYLTNPMSQTPTKSTLPTMSQQTSSYANVTSSTCYPKKDQAVILDAVEGIPLREYIVGLSTVIPATSIRFVSRISNARVCIYLDTKKTADSLIDNKKRITIKNHSLEIKPLLTKNKRIVLSNVCPVIPNYIIEEKFEELKIKIMSPISFMKIGATEPGFSHILSFRRQLFISPEDEAKLPDYFQVTFDDTNYWIYISTDALKCFVCNSMGHLAKNCTKQSSIPQSLNKETENQGSNDIGLIFSSTFVSPSIPEPSETREENTNKRIKRLHSPSISEASKIDNIKDGKADNNDENSDFMEIETDESSTNVSIEKEITKTKKKLKRCDSRSEEEVWRNIENNIDEMKKDSEFPIDLDQFISLLDNSRGNINIKDLVYSYTDNVKDLIYMCNSLYCKMNKSLKNRCSRLTKKLHQILTES